MVVVVAEKNKRSVDNPNIKMPEGFVTSEEYEKTLPLGEQVMIQEKSKEMYTELKLEQLRKQLKVSQKDIAERMNITQSQVSKIEKNPNVELRTLRRFLNSLGLEMVIFAKKEDGDLVPIVK